MKIIQEKHWTREATCRHCTSVLLLEEGDVFYKESVGSNEEMEAYYGWTCAVCQTWNEDPRLPEVVQKRAKPFETSTVTIYDPVVGEIQVPSGKVISASLTPTCMEPGCQNHPSYVCTCLGCRSSTAPFRSCKEHYSRKGLWDHHRQLRGSALCWHEMEPGHETDR